MDAKRSNKDKTKKQNPKRTTEHSRKSETKNDAKSKLSLTSKRRRLFVEEEEIDDDEIDYVPETPMKNMPVKTTSPSDQDGFEDPEITDKEIEDEESEEDDEETSEKVQNDEDTKVRKSPEKEPPHEADATPTMARAMADAHNQAMAKQLEQNAKLIEDLQRQLREKERAEVKEKEKGKGKEEEKEKEDKYKIPKNKITPEIIEQRKEDAQELTKNIIKNKRKKAIAIARKNELQDFLDRELYPKGLQISVNITPMMAEISDIMETFSAEKKQFEIKTMRNLIAHHIKVETQMKKEIKEDNEQLTKLKRILPGEDQFWEDIEYQNNKAQMNVEKELKEMEINHNEKARHLAMPKKEKRKETGKGKGHDEREQKEKSQYKEKETKKQWQRNEGPSRKRPYKEDDKMQDKEHNWRRREQLLKELQELEERKPIGEREREEERKADKGAAIIVENVNDYITKGLEHLNDENTKFTKIPWECAQSAAHQPGRLKVYQKL
ncbi:DNA ligase 1-like [Oscarella lobularis]|uniref:DNA ligase 1-like n=1 Tax=Oscarella lobularis TaxID=121494 RepID=UPI0033142D0E